MGYYNTTNETGEALKQSQVKAESQAEKIMKLFKRQPYYNFTPFEIQSLIGLKTPITSIRRAMSDLTKEGDIFKSEKKKKGEYGKNNYTWTFFPELSLTIKNH